MLACPTYRVIVYLEICICLRFYNDRELLFKSSDKGVSGQWPDYQVQKLGEGAATGYPSRPLLDREFDMGLARPLSRSVRLNGFATCLWFEQVYWGYPWRESPGIIAARSVPCRPMWTEVHLRHGGVKNFSGLVRVMCGGPASRTRVRPVWGEALVPRRFGYISSSRLKLLRLLQEGDYLALGSDITRHSDTRIIASTNQDLWALENRGKFRKDLIYRLSTHRLTIPQNLLNQMEFNRFFLSL